MIIFLYGLDTYRSRQKLNAIINRYKSIHKSGLALTKFEQENFDLEEFRKKLRTISMFNEKKLIVLEGLLGNFEDKQILLKLKDTEDVIVVFWEQKPDKGSNLFKWLKGNVQCQEFKPLEISGLRRWAEKRLRTANCKITPEAKEKLIFFIGSDLWRASNEIEKLIAFKKQEEITARDVGLLVSPLIDLNIFETIDALAKGTRARALELIWKHLSGGSDPLYLFSMILWQFRNLIKVSSGPGADLHPFVVKKSTFLARRFTQERLKIIYEYLLDMDLGIKTGRIDPRVALDMLVMEI